MLRLQHTDDSLSRFRDKQFTISVDKFVGSANRENCGESATHVGELRQESRKVAIGRPVEAAGTEMEEIRVGDDAHLSLAQRAARQQSAIADCTTGSGL